MSIGNRIDIQNCKIAQKSIVAFHSVISIMFVRFEEFLCIVVNKYTIWIGHVNHDSCSNKVNPLRQSGEVLS